MKFTTLSDIVDHIHNPAANVADHLLPHLETLKGPRNRGSNTKVGLAELLNYGNNLLHDIDKSDLALVGSNSQCWYIELTDEQIAIAEPRINCTTLEQYSNSEPDEDKIVCRKGLHGWELVLETPCPIDIPTNRIYFIWSNPDNCLATWHPGKPMVFLPQNCAVKLR